MQISNYRSTSSDDLLNCRMAMLGLDLSALEGYDGAMFEANCGNEVSPRPEVLADKIPLLLSVRSSCGTSE